ncbi:MAG: ribosome biogenesis GTPase YlqF [Oscillospiraceae bacterium]|nr:ribosome biogenesis GTPase YlqF [Oscillospiraceae bacterium]
MTMSENSEKLNIQWYPGHMTRTRRQMAESLKLVDAVVEVVDARIPRSSRNPDIDGLVGGKPRVLLLNKADYADQAATKRWIGYFAARGIKAISCDCRSGSGLGGFPAAVRAVLADQIKRWESRGMSGRHIKLLVAGIPNVGKSSFINRMSKTGKARVADRPGVTRGNQWFTISGGIELLDTPGVLWPKFDDPLAGLHLAVTGAIKDAVMDTETLAAELIKLLIPRCPGVLAQRYKLEDDDLSVGAAQLLALIASNRGMLVSGGQPDTERAAVMLLDEFRGGKLGRITLEEVD